MQTIITLAACIATVSAINIHGKNSGDAATSVGPHGTEKKIAAATAVGPKGIEKKAVTSYNGRHTPLKKGHYNASECMKTYVEASKKCKTTET